MNNPHTKIQRIQPGSWFIAMLRRVGLAWKVSLPENLPPRPERIPLSHPLVRRGTALGLPCFGSPTLSDQALMPFPTLKIGPGESARSHSADEFVYLREIEEAIGLYRQLIQP